MITHIHRLDHAHNLLDKKHQSGGVYNYLIEALLIIASIVLTALFWVFMDYVINSSKKASLVVSEINIEQKKKAYEDLQHEYAIREYSRDSTLFSKTIVKSDLPILFVAKDMIVQKTEEDIV